VNIIRKGYKSRIGMCTDKKGNLITENRTYYRDGQYTDELLNGHGDEDGNKGDGDGDGEGETEDTIENLDKENEDEEYGTDRNLETKDVPTKE